MVLVAALVAGCGQDPFRTHQPQSRAIDGDDDLRLRVPRCASGDHACVLHQHGNNRLGELSPEVLATAGAAQTIPRSFWLRRSTRTGRNGGTQRASTRTRSSLTRERRSAGRSRGCNAEA